MIFYEYEIEQTNVRVCTLCLKSVQCSVCTSCAHLVHILYNSTIRTNKQMYGSGHFVYRVYSAQFVHRVYTLCTFCTTVQGRGKQTKVKVK